jgi:hypothetical protein
MERGEPMTSDDIVWDKIKEKRDDCFVEYQPPRTYVPFASLQLVFPGAVDTAFVAKAMEDELKRWLSRFPVPVMVSAFDATEALIALTGVRPCNHLMDYVGADDREIRYYWRLLAEAELPKNQTETLYLSKVYSGMPFKLGEDVRRNANAYARSIRIGWWIVFVWSVMIPATVAIVEWAAPSWLAALVLVYALYKAAVQALRLTGKLKTSPREQKKAAEDLRMRHHHYHCERNPDAFRRLMIENFDAEARDRVRKEMESLQ